MLTLIKIWKSREFLVVSSEMLPAQLDQMDLIAAAVRYPALTIQYTSYQFT